jgi:hypothetical protein
MKPAPDEHPLADFTQDYRTIMLRFLPSRDERARAAGYDVGRRAFEARVSLLDVCRVHHVLLHEVLGDTTPDLWLAVSETSAELLLEVLAAYDMTHRSVLEQGSADDGRS